jgi:hypothetical protein
MLYLLCKRFKIWNPIRFKIVGFVDKNNQNATKRMLDLPFKKKKYQLLNAFQTPKLLLLIKVCLKKSN